MAVWRVVLLVNLALAVGVGWGYVWWGRQAAQLARELTAARAAAATGEEREYRGEGVVRAVLPEMNVLVITHDEIPGYMPPMTMGFRTVSPRLHETVEIGDSIRFVLRGSGSNVAIVAVEKLAR